jgi:hypothetical protein
MDLVGVLAGCIGGILMWCAIKNKHPLDVIKFSLQGKPLDSARPMFLSAGTPAPIPGPK